MIDDVLAETKEKMTACITALDEDLRGMRSGRASTALVDRLIVEYYGQPTELRQMANISTPEALQILIRPYDVSSLKDIERAINEANIGVNPNSDGAVIRLNMPPLTGESRQKLVKFLHERLEKAKVTVRNIRRDANKDLKEFKNEGMISEDDERRGEDQVQKLTDQFSAKIDEMGAAKEKEITDI
jgi:ribosome recycling factor